MKNQKIIFFLLFHIYSIVVTAQLYVGGGLSYNFLDVKQKEKYTRSMKLLDTNYQVRHPSIHLNIEYYFSKKLSVAINGQYGIAESAMVTKSIISINLFKFYYYNYSTTFNYVPFKGLRIGAGINYFRIRKGENFHEDRVLVGKFPEIHNDIGLSFTTGYTYKNVYINFLYGKSLKSFGKEVNSINDSLQPVDIISLQMGYRVKIPQLIHRKKKTEVDCPKF